MIFPHTTNPAEPHPWFAWHPVKILHRTTQGPEFYNVWLQTVVRRAVAVQGALVWVYEFPKVEPMEIGAVVEEAPESFGERTLRQALSSVAMATAVVVPDDAVPTATIVASLAGEGYKVQSFDPFMDLMMNAGYDAFAFDTVENIELPPKAGVLFVSEDHWRDLVHLTSFKETFQPSPSTADIAYGFMGIWNTVEVHCDAFTDLDKDVRTHDTLVLFIKHDNDKTQPDTN